MLDEDGLHEEVGLAAVVEETRDGADAGSVRGEVGVVGGLGGGGDVGRGACALPLLDLPLLLAVEVEEVGVVRLQPGGLRIRVEQHISRVLADERTGEDLLSTAHAPSASNGLDDLKRQRDAAADDAIGALGRARARRVALEDAITREEQLAVGIVGGASPSRGTGLLPLASVLGGLVVYAAAAPVGER